MFHAGQVLRARTRALIGDASRPPSHSLPMAVKRAYPVPPSTLFKRDFTPRRWAWNVAADCVDPVSRDFYGKPWRDQAKGISIYSHPEWVEIRARCRRCERCMFHRQRLWYGRTLGELRRSAANDERVWFITLTASWEQRTEWTMDAIRQYNRRGKSPPKGVSALSAAKRALPPTSWEALSEAQQFGLIHQRINPEITRWLGRLRRVPIIKWRDRRRQVVDAAKRHGRKLGLKGMEFTAYHREVRYTWEGDNPCPKPAQFRYLLVTEAHKESGVFPHYHLLLHEVAGTLGERDIRGQWRSRHGYAEATLVHFGEKLLKPNPRKPGRMKLVRGQPEDWTYLVKYLGKSSLARVRASKSYGQVKTLPAKSASAPKQAPGCATREDNSPSKRTSGNRGDNFRSLDQTDHSLNSSSTQSSDYQSSDRAGSRSRRSESAYLHTQQREIARREYEQRCAAWGHTASHDWYWEAGGDPPRGERPT